MELAPGGVDPSSHERGMVELCYEDLTKENTCWFESAIDKKFLKMNDFKRLIIM